mmetsp:Transcript_5906/g.14172  ORF Transcript_5906/g.14172 Transcript_5906/m.14172 type:complete len:179 (-) Transcript_5906:72-608(-)
MIQKKIQKKLAMWHVNSPSPSDVARPTFTPCTIITPCTTITTTPSAACEKALDLDPKYVKAIARKGDIEFLRKEYHKALETYQKGLTIEPDNKACKDGLQKTMRMVNSSTGSGEVDKERAAHGMADPEIQAILRDPVVNQVIQDLSGGDQAAGQRAMADPVMSAKIQKLIAAGVLQTR